MKSLLSYIKYIILVFCFNFRMLYCSTSSQYRTAFLRVISCGRLHAHGRWGHGDYSGGNRAGRNGRTQTARSLLQRPNFGFGRRRTAQMESGSGTISPMGSERFRGGGEQNNERISGTAGEAGGPLAVNRAAYPPNKYSAQQIQTAAGLAVAIELQPMCDPLALETQHLDDTLANGLDVDSGGMSRDRHRVKRIVLLKQQLEAHLSGAV